MSTPTLGVILVEYRSMDDVRGCLESLAPFLEGVDAHTCIASNSQYTAAEQQRLLAEFGDRFQSTEVNDGYAGGVNFALQALPRCDHYLVINPDARWESGQLADLLEQLRRTPDVAILGPEVRDEAGVPQPSRRAFPKLLTYALTRSFLARTRPGQAEVKRYHMTDFRMDSIDEPAEVDWVSGGAMIISRAAIEVMGPMDERYFMYMEDVDWCRSAWFNGFRVVYSPRWSVMHAGQHASLRSMRQARAHLMSIARYFPKWIGKPRQRTA